MKNDSKRMHEVLWEQGGEEPRGRVMEDTQRKAFTQHLGRSRMSLPGKDGRVPQREHRRNTQEHTEARCGVWKFRQGRCLGLHLWNDWHLPLSPVCSLLFTWTFRTASHGLLSFRKCFAISSFLFNVNWNQYIPALTALCTEAPSMTTV